MEGRSNESRFAGIRGAMPVEFARKKSNASEMHVENIDTERRRSSLANSLRKFHARGSFGLGRRKSSTANAQVPVPAWFADRLPAEIQVQIFLGLSIPEILSFRLVSQACNETIMFNQSALARGCIHAKLPAYISDLWLAHTDNDDTPVVYDIRLLTSLAQRYSATSRVAAALADFVQDEWLLCRSAADRRRFASDHAILRAQLVRPLLTLAHLIEVRRAAVLAKHAQRVFPAAAPALVSKALGRLQQSTSFDELPYSEDAVFEASYAFDFLIAMMKRHLRPPSYASPIERAFRGWLVAPPKQGDVNALAFLGGMGPLGTVLHTSSYEKRRGALADFVRELDTEDDGVRAAAWTRLLYGPYAPPTPFPDGFFAPVAKLPDMKDLGLTLRQMCMAMPEHDDTRPSPREYVERILQYNVVEVLRYRNTLEAQVGRRAESDAQYDASSPVRIGARVLDTWWADQ